MGTQQLLLIILAVILIGIMIAIGMFMFQDQSAATNRDEITNDLVNLAAQAQKYYRRPGILGGGSNSFGGLTLMKMTSKPSNANGSYSMTPDPVPAGTRSIQVTGTGTETGLDDSTPVEVVMTVWADSLFMVTNN
jgi:type II secretory pathway pseudopilin PulG